jgi:putative transposase
MLTKTFVPNRKERLMKDDKTQAVKKPARKAMAAKIDQAGLSSDAVSTQEATTSPAPVMDVLTEILRAGAQQLLATAIEAEVEDFLESYRHVTDLRGRRQVVRNGYHPARSISTGVGPVVVEKPKVRDLSGNGIQWHSGLLPAYLKSTKTASQLLPWLYLKGVSSGDMESALKGLLGEQAALSDNTVSRLKAQWIAELAKWQKRDLSKSKYVYWWVDGIYSAVRGEADKLCSFVILGVTQAGDKELIALEEGYRESEESWLTLLRGLKERGLVGAKLAIADGALGFWKALPQVYPHTEQQNCWVHKTRNVLDKLPKSQQPAMKQALHNIYLAPTHAQAQRAWKACEKRFGDKYPKAIASINQQRHRLLTFYHYPAAHWQSIRTTNPIESSFATVRQRTQLSKNCGTRNTVLAMIHQLLQQAQTRWKRLPQPEHLVDIMNKVVFIDGEKRHEQTPQNIPQTEQKNDVETTPINEAA